MVNIHTIIYVAKSLHKEDIEGKEVLEVGSLDHNGTVRSLVESFKPNKYVGVDFIAGEGVDLVCRAEDLINIFGKESFDVIIATELLQHTKNWKDVIHNMKNVCKKEGIMLISARSKGFNGYHGYPQDYWRYEIEDINKIFSDFNISVLEKDKNDDGVLIKLIKPKNFIENNLSEYNLYSIVVNKRIQKLSKKDLKNLSYQLMAIRYHINKFILKVGKKLLR
jgi:ubiquinone/menaquinone biosynthesis C-methylase UbiE